MSAGYAHVNSDPRLVGLQHFNDQTIIRLGVGPGTYLVFGRVVIGNNDGDDQNAGARMTSKDGSDLIDKSDVRIPAGCAQSLSLQGTLRVEEGHRDVIDIRCGTYNGFAQQSSLFTLEVSQLRF